MTIEKPDHLRDPRLDDEEEGDGGGEKEIKLEGAKIALDVLRRQRTVLISEVITPKLTARLTKELLWLDSESNDPIKVMINTPGGSADDGFAIYDMLKFVKSPVTTVTVGLNASAGTIVMLAAPKERRFALPNARIMLHQPSGGIRGTASDVEISADEIIKLRRRVNELVAKETGKSADEVKQDLDRDKWLSPEEAMEYGLIGKIVTERAELE